jgi:hypothetical protein
MGAVHTSPTVGIQRPWIPGRGVRFQPARVVDHRGRKLALLALESAPMNRNPPWFCRLLVVGLLAAAGTVSALVLPTDVRLGGAMEHHNLVVFDQGGFGFIEISTGPHGHGVLLQPDGTWAGELAFSTPSGGVDNLTPGVPVSGTWRGLEDEQLSVLHFSAPSLEALAKSLETAMPLQGRPVQGSPFFLGRVTVGKVSGVLFGSAGPSTPGSPAVHADLALSLVYSGWAEILDAASGAPLEVVVFQGSLFGAETQL